MTDEHSENSPSERSAGDTPSVEELQKALDEAKAKADALLNNWKRAQADLENLRKRTEQEKQETTLWAGVTILTPLIPVLDDFSRALTAIEAESKAAKWAEGISLVYKKLQTTLESQGVTMIAAVGQTFDPKVHEAVMKVDGEEGKVVTELQKGYKYRDRVLRPAFVAVGNGNKESKKDGE